MYFQRHAHPVPKLDFAESPEDSIHYQSNKENCSFTSPIIPYSNVLNMLETSGSFQFCPSILVSDGSVNELDNAVLLCDETPPGSGLPVLHEVSTSSVSPIGANTTLKVSMNEECLPQPTPIPPPAQLSRFDFNEGPQWSPGIGNSIIETETVTHRTRGSLANLFAFTSPQEQREAPMQQVFKSLAHQRSASVPLPSLVPQPSPLKPLITGRSFRLRPVRQKPMSTDERVLQEAAEARKRLRMQVEKGMRVAAKFKEQTTQRSAPAGVQISRMVTLPRGPKLRTAERAEIRRNRTIIN